MPGNRPKKGGAAIFIAVILFGLFIWYFWGGGLERQTASSVQDIDSKVASDAVEQYRIAERQGDKMQICVQAGLVAAAFLQAKDEANYGIWKDTEKQQCAGLGFQNKTYLKQFRLLGVL